MHNMNGIRERETFNGTWNTRGIRRARPEGGGLANQGGVWGSFSDPVECAGRHPLRQTFSIPTSSPNSHTGPSIIAWIMLGQQKQRDADEMQMTLAFQVLPICWENRSKCAKGQMNDVDKKSLRGLEVGEFLKTREVGEPSAGRRLLGDGVELCLQGQVG